jgi:hypothetical protein
VRVGFGRAVADNALIVPLVMVMPEYVVLAASMLCTAFGAFRVIVPPGSCFGGGVAAAISRPPRHTRDAKRSTARIE